MRIKRILSSLLLVCLFNFFGKVEPEVTSRDVGFCALGAALGVSAVVLAKALVASMSKEKQIEFTMIPEDDNQMMPYSVFHEKNLSDFVGQESVVSQVREFLDEVSIFDDYRVLGAKKLKALLIESPTGNGKSLLAKAIAGELDCCMIPVDGYFFAENIPEVSEAKMRYTFDFAFKKAREELTILFIDNIDVFCSINEYYQFDVTKRRLINTFVNYIKEIDKSEKLIVIATSNSSSSLDSSLFKPGVFDRSIHVPLPTLKGREQILNYYLHEISIGDTVDKKSLENMAEQTAGFNASLLEDITKEAAILAGREYSRFVEQEHLFEAVKKVKLRKQTLVGQKKDETFYYTFSEKTKFYDVIGQEEAIVEIKEFVQFLKSPERYVSLGARQPRGLLLHGPSGCGKTLIAKAIAGEAGCCFISVSGSEFVKKYVGTGAGNVRAIFNFARKMSKEVPVIIFIDEIDGLGRRQGTDESGANTEYNNTINEMLKQIDGFTRDDNILIIGATNLMEELDPALLRPGRFDRKVLIGLPKKEERKEILEYFLSKISVDPDILNENLAKEFAENTTGFSGAALENFVNEAAILAARNGNLFVYKKRFDQALDKILLGLENKINSPPEQLEKTAYHEAGHALLAVLLNIPVEKVSILPRSNAFGITRISNKHEYGSYYTKDELFHEMICFYGGFVAEKLMFGQTTPGVSDDLKKCGNIAYEMINKLGMGTGILEGVPRIVSSQDSLKEFDKETIKLMNNAYSKAKEFLSKYKNYLVEFSKELLQKETLNKEEIYQIFTNIRGAEA